MGVGYVSSGAGYGRVHLWATVYGCRRVCRLRVIGAGYGRVCPRTMGEAGPCSQRVLRGGSFSINWLASKGISCKLSRIQRV